VKKLSIFGMISVILLSSIGILRAGTYTPNNYFYLPALGASGMAEYNAYNAALSSTDSIIKGLMNYKHTHANMTLLQDYTFSNTDIVNLQAASHSPVTAGTGITISGGVGGQVVNNNDLGSTALASAVKLTGNQTVNGKKIFDVGCELSSADTTLIITDAQIVTKKYADHLSFASGAYSGSYPLITADYSDSSVSDTKIITLSASKLTGTITPSDSTVNDTKITGVAGSKITDNSITDTKIISLSATKITGLSSNYIPAVSAVQGDLLYYDTNQWKALGYGAAGNVLSTNGASANPSWVTNTPANGSVGLAQLAPGIAQVNSVVGVSDISTTSTSYVDMTDMTYTDTFTASNIQIMFKGAIQHSAAVGYVRILLDDVAVDTTLLYAAGVTSVPAVCVWVGAVTAASHTIHIEWKIASGSATQYGTLDPRRLIIIRGLN
jgi:hypothetical protein